MKKAILLTILALGLSLSAARPAQAVPPTFYFDITIDATATQMGDLWLYQYTLIAEPAPGDNYRLKDISHWWIELPEIKTDDISDVAIYSPFDPEVGSFNENDGPFAGTINGVKWETGELLTFSFKSTHSPVLLPNGDIDPGAYLWFAKTGGDFYDFGDTLGPNGHHVIPEPATLFLMGSGLVSFLGIRRKV